MLTSILEWIAGWILNYLLGKSELAIKDAIDDLGRDKERGVTNGANVEKYEAAKARKDRIDTALALLNRSAP